MGKIIDNLKGQMHKLDKAMAKDLKTLIKPIEETGKVIDLTIRDSISNIQLFKVKNVNLKRMNKELDKRMKDLKFK